MAKKIKEIDSENEKSESSGNTPEEQLNKYLKENRADHINFEREKDYLISSKSLTFDIETGGIRPSVLRMSGISEGGKTACTLSFMDDFLSKPEKRRGVYIKAEGRLGKEQRERTTIKFVENSEEWVDGTCFIFKTNIYEAAISLMRDLVNNNPSETSYFFVIDSMDALVPRGDIDKPFEEANKVAGGSLLSADFLRKMSLKISSRGHICVLISQVRSTVSINPYAKTDPKITNASGGNAALHYSDWIFEFQQRHNKDFIWAGEEGKSERLGHYCKVIFRKTPNESTGIEIRYPIKYGRKDGKSVWVEYEIVDQMLAFNMAIKEGAWVKLSDSIVKELSEKKVPHEPKFNGVKKFRDYLESTPAFTNYMFNKFKSTLGKDEVV